MSHIISTTSSEPLFEGSGAEYDQYRVLSVLAVASLVLAIVSLPSLFFVQLLFLPLLGLVLGLRSIATIRAASHEFTGLPIAIAGSCLSALVLVAGITWSTYVYFTEVPEGFTRVQWHELKPDTERPELPVSPRSLELNGQPVFIKGYIYPDESGGDLRKFVLIPDMGTCCFGGQPALTDMIEVTLKGDLRARYSIRKIRLAGTLQVDTKKKPVSGLDGVYYQMMADYVK